MSSSERPHTLTRRERIEVLLDNYVDVLNGLRDRGGDGEHLPLMCRPWNKPRLGYPELERLRLRMREEEPTLYWHLRERYMDYSTRQVRICASPTCTVTYPSWIRINFHTHGRRHVPLISGVRRIYSPRVEKRVLELAIDWLDAQWQGGVFLPDELQPTPKAKEVAA